MTLTDGHYELEKNYIFLNLLLHEDCRTHIYCKANKEIMKELKIPQIMEFINRNFSLNNTATHL
jgi:hypothetical protein